jgi:hypothetical protein
MKRLSILSIGFVFLALVLLAGCEPAPPTGGDCFTAGAGGQVTLTVPSTYDCTVTGAAITTHRLVLNTPAVSSGHPFEIDVTSSTVTGRGTLIIHTAVSPATTMTTTGSQLNIQVTGSDKASSARFGVATSQGVIEAAASRGWILIRFAQNALEGRALLTTEDPRVPEDLRTLDVCFTAAIAQITDGTTGGTGGENPPGVPG